MRLATLGVSVLECVEELVPKKTSMRIFEHGLRNNFINWCRLTMVEMALEVEVIPAEKIKKQETAREMG